MPWREWLTGRHYSVVLVGKESGTVAVLDWLRFKSAEEAQSWVDERPYTGLGLTEYRVVDMRSVGSFA